MCSPGLQPYDHPQPWCVCRYAAKGQSTGGVPREPGPRPDASEPVGNQFLANAAPRRANAPPGRGNSSSPLKRSNKAPAQKAPPPPAAPGFYGDVLGDQ